MGCVGEASKATEGKQKPLQSHEVLHAFFSIVPP